MKITIDTTQKVITLDQEVKLKDLFDFLQDLLKDDWQEYTLQQTKEVIYKTSPVFGPSKDKNPYRWDRVGDTPYEPPVWKPYSDITYFMSTPKEVMPDMQESLDKSLNKGFSDKPTTLNG